MIVGVVVFISCMYFERCTSSEINSQENATTTNVHHLQDANFNNQSCSRQSFEKRFADDELLKPKDQNLTFEKWVKNCYSVSESKCHRNFSDGIHAEIFTNGVEDLFLTLNARQQKGCYGYILSVDSYRNGIRKVEHLILHQRFNFTLNYLLEVEYKLVLKLTLKEIPSGRTSIVSKDLPDICESRLAHTIQTEPTTCDIIRNNKQILLVFCKSLCIKYGNSVLAFPFVNRTVINYCRQLEAEEELSKSSNISASFLSILVVVVIGVLFTILGLLAACFWRLRTRKYNRGVSGGGRGAVIEGEEQRERLTTNEGGESMNEKMENNEQKQYNGLVKRKNKTSPPTVMLLSRPGCELMDTLLRDLAYILKSNGIKITFSLLEQSELDAEGGISSFLQRNIDSCDFILIMFTDHPQSKSLHSHKPFEFALKVITGLMYYRHDTSRYITMYLDPFKTAMHYIPSVFHATQNYGFRIPKDLKKLVSHLCDGLLTPLSIEEQQQQQQQRDLKNKLFVNRMKNTTKKLQNLTHDGCDGSRCFKGKRCPSISHLSSLWATTVASKKGEDPFLDVNNESEIPRQQVIELLDDNFETENNNLFVERWREAANTNMCNA